ncbi:MAG TPA: heparin lyase I family protein [Terriglobales bacterium]
MNTFYKALAAALLLAPLAIILLRAVPIHVYDGFESPRLSWIRWSRHRFVPGAVAPEDFIVRSGHRALAITVHSGDRYEAASEEGAATERDELMESWWLYSHPGRTYVYSFSLFIPQDFAQPSERLVIAQWKQLCWHCHPDNPVLAIHYDHGGLRVTRRDATRTEELYRTNEDVRGRWLDFRFVIRFDPTAAGLVDATLNRTPIIHYRGPTTYLPPRGHLLHRVYFKTGLYRDALGQPPWTIYLDEYRKDQ